MRGLGAGVRAKKNSLGEAIVGIAQLGGYLHRASDGPPGYECLGQGFVLFNAMVKILAQAQTA